MNACGDKSKELQTPAFPSECGKVEIGHAGTQTIENSQAIIVQGVVVLCGQVYLENQILKPMPVVESMLDLDTGTVGLESADLQFCPSGGTMIFYAFCSINNVFVKIYSLNGLTMEYPQEPTYEECSNVKKPYQNSHDNEPKYACVITNLGNVSRINVEQYNPLGDNVMALEISFITWAR
jgi:hypothetical protein